MPLHAPIDWRAAGLTLENVGQRRLLREPDGTFDISDGDTPNIRLAIRMLSIDTAETYTADSAVARLEEGFARLADWIGSGQSSVSAGLGAHLIPRLRRRHAVRIHREQGRTAGLHFRYLAQTRLVRADGSVRQLFLRSSDEKVDGYGRLLAYAAPNYSRSERDRFRSEAGGDLRAELRQRATFNLQLVEAGQAATFIVFPSLPGRLDLEIFHEAAIAAVTEKRGFWTDELALLGYEFRMCEKLVSLQHRLENGEAVSERDRSWITRHCASIRTGELVGPQDYWRIPPEDRLFIWPRDVDRAASLLHLTRQEEDG